jgi:hypothetical protein
MRLNKSDLDGSVGQWCHLPDGWVEALQLLEDLEALCQLGEDVHYRAREVRVLGVLPKLKARTTNFISTKRTGYFIISQKKNPEWDFLVLLQIFCLINASKDDNYCMISLNFLFQELRVKCVWKSTKNVKLADEKEWKFSSHIRKFGWDLVNSTLYLFTISSSDAL